MTAIVGIAKINVWLGADSCAATTYYRTAMAGSKLVDVRTGRGTLTLGYTTSFRFGQILQYEVSPPHDVRDDAGEYLIRDFLPTVRTALSEHGWLKKKDEREEGGTALIGYRDRLFTLHEDLSIQENRDGLNACGSGYDYALGAMHHALAVAQPPEEVLRAGLQAAGYFAPGVMEPFVIQKVI